MTAPTLNEMARDAAHNAILSKNARKLKDEAHATYNEAFIVFRKVYRQTYMDALCLGSNAVWTDRLEEGFNRGFSTESGIRHLTDAGLRPEQVDAHTETIATLRIAAEKPRGLYKLYYTACKTYIDTYKEALAKATARLEKQNDE